MSRGWTLLGAVNSAHYFTEQTLWGEVLDNYNFVHAFGVNSVQNFSCGRREIRNNLSKKVYKIYSGKKGMV